MQLDIRISTTNKQKQKRAQSIMFEDFKLPISLILKQLNEIENSFSSNLSAVSKLSNIRKNAYQLQYLLKQVSALRKLELGEVKLETVYSNFQSFLNLIPTTFPINKTGNKINLLTQVDIPDVAFHFDPTKLEHFLYETISIYSGLAPKIEQVDLKIYQKESTDNSEKNLKYTFLKLEGNIPDLKKNQLKLFQQIIDSNDSLNPENYSILNIKLAIIVRLIALFQGQMELSFQKAKVLKISVQFPLNGLDNKINRSPTALNTKDYFKKTLEEYDFLRVKDDEWLLYNEKYQLNLKDISSSDQQFMLKVLSLIETHLDEDSYWVDELVTDMFISRSTLFRRLRKVIKQAPNDFMRTIRLKNAAAFLQNRQLTISEISYEVGFKNPNYFGTCFRQMYGVPPSLYATKTEQD